MKVLLPKQFDIKKKKSKIIKNYILSPDKKVIK